MLVHKHIAGLFNGISEQAPTLRLPSQASKQVNGWSSLVYGLTKRPPTRFISKLTQDVSSTDFRHKIDRGVGEQFIINIKANGSLSVFDVKGNTYPVLNNTPFRRYLASPRPQQTLRGLSIADTTFISNTLNSVGLEPTSALKPTSIVTHSIYKVSIMPPSNTYLDAWGVETFSITDSSTALIHLKTTIDGGKITGLFVRTTPRVDALKQIRDTLNTNPAYSVSEITDNSFTILKHSAPSFTLEGSANIKLEKTEGTNVAIKYGNVGYVYVAKGVAGQNYKIYVSGVLAASYASGDTNDYNSYKTDVIAKALYDQVVTKADLTARLRGSVLEIIKKDGSDFTLTCVDSWGGAALKGFKGAAQSFSELPARCFEGAVLQVVGKTNADEGSYWVKYSETLSGGGKDVKTTGSWVETSSPVEVHTFDKTTLPVKLLRLQDLNKYQSVTNPLGIYFKLDYADFTARKVGDNTSNPLPSFVGKAITDMALYSDRLAIIAGNSVSLSAAGDYLNFFSSTVTDNLDDAPIDLEAPSSQTPTLTHLVALKDALMLFSPQQQFILHSGGEPLTARSVTISSVLQYPCHPLTAPLVVGQMVYFSSPRGLKNNIREFFLTAQDVVGDAPNITAHVSGLIPNKDQKKLAMVGLPNEESLFISDGSANLYVYKFSYNGDTKVQSSWGVWTFYDAISYVATFDNTLYILFKNGNFEKLEMLKDNNLNYVDSYQRLKQGISFSSPLVSVAYDLRGNKIQTIPPSTPTAFNKDVFIGYLYDFIYEFSPIFLTLRDDDKQPLISGATLLRTLRLYLEDRCSFNLKLKDIKNNKSRCVYNYTTPYNTPKFYQKLFLLRGDSKDTTIELTSKNELGLTLTSATFEILLALRSKPV